MDLSTNSIGWHRTPGWLDDEIDRITKQHAMISEEPEQAGGEYSFGILDGMRLAYMRVCARFDTPEENAVAEQTRREMFG